ncbi:patatin-like protein 2 [Pyrus ussuriensis x Pyrus communis]|uniref:Patatin-like protein 2 n=1 Tax=Pyrus ussuriensis x Pyrus communis TaxID=2448454 RepID=A0A5N5HSB1_9ROSA|nr:patatin-like protein 2 [Pyrus ussuriensis x Pyrus communis]
MLATPDENNHPVFAAKDIKDFYLTHCPKNLPPETVICPLFPKMTKIIKALSGPKYDGMYLHDLVGQKLGSKKLHQTLTNVVIPTFDIKQLQPTIFSSYEVKSKPCFDALHSDICIATSATYLPAHYFETTDPEGEFAIGEVTKTIINGSEDFFPIKPMDYGRFLVISPKWGLLDWLTSGGGTPLIDVFSQSSSDMHVIIIFLVNLETGRVEPCKHESNEEALTRFAELLSEEKWLRLARSPVGHVANPGFGSSSDPFPRDLRDQHMWTVDKKSCCHNFFLFLYFSRKMRLLYF